MRTISQACRVTAKAHFVLLIAVGAACSVQAYPEYQAFSQKNSGMGVSCAMCHVSPDGPEGAGHGQIGGLSKEEMQKLNEARGAFEPGTIVESPILNAFGNEMIRQLGKKKLIELKAKPEELAAALDPASDLDDDGVPDAREFNEGTHPLHKTSGNPWLLFWHNLKRHPFPLTMVIVATALMLYGLKNLHMALEIRSRATNEDDEPDLNDEDAEPSESVVQTPQNPAKMPQTVTGYVSARTISDK